MRVLKQDMQSSSPSAVSRDWELKTTGNGVHYSIGGKITSAREDAADIVDTVCAELGSQAACATRGRFLPWAPQHHYAEWFAAKARRAAQLGVDQESALWLLRRHGQRVSEIFRMIENDAQLAQRILPSLPFIHADLLLCARTEMVVHLDDLLRRRMPLLILSRQDEAQLRMLAARVSSTLEWDPARQVQEVSRCLPFL